MLGSLPLPSRSASRPQAFVSMDNQVPTHSYSRAQAKKQQRNDLGSQLEQALKLFALSESSGAVREVLQFMKAEDVYIEESHCHQLVRSLAFAEDFDQMHQALQEMTQAQQEPSEATWTTVLSAYEQHRSSEALSLIDKALHLCYPQGPQIEDYQVVLSACRQLQSSRFARYILQHATTHLPQQVPIELWNQLAWVYSLCKEHGQIRSLMERLYDMGIDPDMDTHAFLIQAHGRAFEVDVALSIFRHLQQEYTQLSETVYLCILDALAQSAQPPDAREAFMLMQRSGITPSTTAYNKLIKAYAHSRSPEAAGRVVEAMQDAGVSPNETTYRCWMYGYAMSRDVDGAEALLRDMLVQDITPSAQTFNILLYCYALSGQLGSARAVIDRMIEVGERPLTVSFNVLANGYGRQHNLEALHALIKDMTLAKVPLNLVTYNTLIKAFCMNHQISKAENMLDHMIQRGLLGDVSTWGALAGAYARKGSVDDLILTFRRCIGGGCLPNKQMYDMVCYLLTRSSIPEKDIRQTIQTITRMVVDAASTSSDHADHSALVQHCLRSSGLAQ
eukprot:m.187776 g.187776  ORF g.187776 m.187776 type:complete len:561 (-) comp16715_c1_seq8:2923-4605(-)